MYDTIVVGAGPAGSMAAMTLADRGMQVLLLEKESMPRKKPCGGGLPIRTINRYPFIKDLHVIESYSYGGYVYSPSLQYTVEIVKEDPILAMVQRPTFDKTMVNYAINHGAAYQDKSVVTDVIIESDYVRLKTNEGIDLKASMVIGADGFLSTISRKTGLHEKNRTHGVSLVEEFPLSHNEMKEYFKEEVFCHVFSKFKGIQGYGWVFPKKDHVNIGLVEYEDARSSAAKRYNLRTLFEQFLSILRTRGIIPRDVVSTAAVGGILPLQPLQRTYANRILLCGDAAGFINPVSGEGIHYAISSGEIAGYIASQAVKHNDFTTSFLSRYQRKWMDEFGKEIKMMLRSKKQWRKEGERTIKLMCTDEKFAEMLFLTMTGKESMYDLRWKIVRRYLFVSFKHIFNREKNTLRSI